MTSEQSLTAAIDQIGKRVDTCRFEFAEPITDPTLVSVKVNGKELSLNQADGNGFTLDASGRVLTLVAAGCVTEGIRSIEIQVSCDWPTRN